ncbi:MAG TPA: adenosylcobalamin-dependent ribonucleoside-diphosphate reductase [Sphingomicrobium sp.]|nr:adenosylcobalamin-dependent ribonucleoside-diphosphate reductase [Sphingomicrobium sp.]
MEVAAPLNTDALSPIAERVWQTKYRRVGLDGNLDLMLTDTFRRVAKALAGAERSHRRRWEQSFFDVMDSLRFLPAGRVLAGAGAWGEATLFNCFVLPPPRNGTEGEVQILEQACKTQELGGGVGFDVSEMAPTGSLMNGIPAKGPVALLQTLEEQVACRLESGFRRAAMMATMSCSHPDIGSFIGAKIKADALRHFNLSVQISNAFLTAEVNERMWPLRFGGRELARVPARGIWDELLKTAFMTAEPGVLFVDCINDFNNLWYRERLTATNPCGEVPLPPFGACVLGSLNLAQFVLSPFAAEARIDEADLVRTSRIAVRMLDDVLDISAFPLPEQRAETLATRRVGLGVMGLADALMMLGLRYDSAQARTWLGHVMRLIRDSAYEASIGLAEERGAFPAFRRDDFLAGGFVATLDRPCRDDIARRGIRNSHLLAIAPTGSISLLAGGISSGIEPAFAAEYERPVPGCRTGETIRIVDHAVQLWRARSDTDAVPPSFVEAVQVSPSDQLAMQVVAQEHVDGAISKTVQLAPDADFESFRRVFADAHSLGLKGCTVFRPGTPRGSLLSPVSPCSRD